MEMWLIKWAYIEYTRLLCVFVFVLLNSQTQAQERVPNCPKSCECDFVGGQGLYVFINNLCAIQLCTSFFKVWFISGSY